MPLKTIKEIIDFENPASKHPKKYVPIAMHMAAFRPNMSLKRPSIINGRVA